MLEKLIEEVGGRTKYRSIHRAVVERIAQRELTNHKSYKDALKATKNKLHQVGAVFVRDKPDYQAWLNQIAKADDKKSACLKLMREHASTNERIPILDQFYSRILEGLPPIAHVIDLGCGLHPLGIPWMPLASGAVYHAHDIFVDMMEFLSAAGPSLGIDINATPMDLVTEVPSVEADAAFLLKLLPTLDQMDKAAGLRLLDGLKVKHIVVSYPCASLTGRGKGMLSTYAAHFEKLVSVRPWQHRSFIFPTELVYLITK